MVLIAVCTSLPLVMLWHVHRALSEMPAITCRQGFAAADRQSVNWNTTITCAIGSSSPVAEVKWILSNGHLLGTSDKAADGKVVSTFISNDSAPYEALLHVADAAGLYVGGRCEICVMNSATAKQFVCTTVVLRADELAVHCESVGMGSTMENGGEPGHSTITCIIASRPPRIELSWRYAGGEMNESDTAGHGTLSSSLEDGPFLPEYAMAYRVAKLTVARIMGGNNVTAATYWLSVNNSYMAQVLKFNLLPELQDKRCLVEESGGVGDNATWTAIISCRVLGKLTAGYFSWALNNVTVDVAAAGGRLVSNLVSSSYGNYEATLRIQNPTAADVGTYSLFFRNTGGFWLNEETYLNPVYLDGHCTFREIQGVPDPFIWNAIVSCNWNSNHPVLKARWICPLKTVDKVCPNATQSEGKFVSTLTNTSEVGHYEATLTFLNPMPEDVGYYGIYVTNAAGRVVYHTLDVKPALLQMNFEAHELEGKPDSTDWEANIVCQLYSDTPVTSLNWTSPTLYTIGLNDSSADGKFVSTLSEGPSGYTSKLQIINPIISDVGIYTITAVTAAGRLALKEYSFNPEPPISVSTDRASGLKLNDTATVTCNFSGNDIKLSHSVQWLRNTEVIATSVGAPTQSQMALDHWINSTTYVLSFKALSATMGGTYTCNLIKQYCTNRDLASMECPNITAALTLLVYGPPLAVSWLNVSQGVLRLPAFQSVWLKFVVHALYNVSSSVRVTADSEDITTQFECGVAVTSNDPPATYEALFSALVNSTQLDRAGFLSVTVSVPMYKPVDVVIQHDVSLLSLDCGDPVQNAPIAGAGWQLAVRCTLETRSLPVEPSWTCPAGEISGGSTVRDGRLESNTTDGGRGRYSIFLKVLDFAQKDLGTYRLIVRNTLGRKASVNIDLKQAAVSTARVNFLSLWTFAILAAILVQAHGQLLSQ